MNFDWTTVLELLISFIGGGSLVSIFTLRQTRESKDIDNASKLIKQYEDLVAKYRAENDNLRHELDELRTKYSDLDARLSRAQDQLDHYIFLHKQAEALRCNKVNCAIRLPHVDKEELVALGIEVPPKRSHKKKK